MGGVGQSLPTGKQVNLIKEFLRGGGGGDTADPPFFLRHWDSEWCWGKIHVFIAILEEKKTQGNWTRWFSAL